MEDLGDAFHSMNHAERMMKKMEAYVNKRSLCDVILVAGQRRLPAHRLVLSAASDYFAAMFTNDVREASMEEIKMKDVDPDALAAIVNFAYTGNGTKQNCSRWHFILLLTLFCREFDISCELSARQMIHLKCQALFSLKNTNK